MKAINGCEKDSTMGERWIIGDYRLKRCPVKEMTHDGLIYLQAYKFYKQGQLPCVDGWLDQTNTFVEAVQVIDGVVAEIDREQQKAK